MKKFLTAFALLLSVTFALCASVCAATDETQTPSPILFHFGAIIDEEDDYTRTDCIVPGDKIYSQRNYTYDGLYEEYVRLYTYDRVNINFSLDFKGNDAFPSVDDLSKYPIIVLGLYNFVTEDNPVCVVKYTTSEGTASINASLQQMSESSIYYIDTRDTEPYDDDDDVAQWENALESLDISFNTYADVCIKYIGFFADKETLRYADILAQMEWREYENDYKLTIPSRRFHFSDDNIGVNSYSYDADGAVSDDSIFEMIKYPYYHSIDYDTLIVDSDNYSFSVETTDKTVSVDGTADNVVGTNGGFTAQVYLSLKDNDGNVVRKIAVGKPIAGTVQANRYYGGDVEFLGAQIRKDGADDALRFGIKVNVGEDKLVKSINKGETDFDNLQALADGLVLYYFGAYIVPKSALPEGGLAPDEFFTRLYYQNWFQYFLKSDDDSGDIEVAVVYGDNIFSTADDNFVYTAVVTDIEDPSAELVVYPFVGYELEAIGRFYRINCYDVLTPFTRSVNGVIEALGNSQTQNWDK